MRVVLLSLFFGCLIINAQAQCDIANSGIAIVNANNTAQLTSAKICVGMTANFKFGVYNLATDPTCSYPVNGVRVVVSFPNSGFTYNGSSSFSTSKFNWTYNSTAKTLTGYNAVVLSQFNGEEILVPVIGVAAASKSISLNLSALLGASDTRLDNNNETAQLTVVDIPTASISYSGTPYCPSGNAAITQTGQIGGVYSSTSGLQINSSTGQVNLATSTPGTYTVKYVFTNGTCSDSTTTNITIHANNLSVVASATTNVLCNGASTGAASGIVSNAIGSVTYAWTNSLSASIGSTSSVSSLPAEIYTLTVTDACFTISDTALITQPTTVTLTSSQTNLLCNGAGTGTVNLTVSGGTPNYTYSWTGPNSYTSNSEDIINLAAGSYTVIVNDANGTTNGCTATTSLTITEPSAVSLSATQTNVSCYGTNTGSVNLTSTEGTSPYTYSWTGPNGYTSSNEDISALAAGTYTVVVNDANGFTYGCTATTSITITQPDALTSAINTSTNVSCSGLSNGSATVTVNGGTTPYSYSWNTTSEQPTATPSGLAAGTYTVSVTDAQGCSSSSSVTITEPIAVTVSATSTNVSCNGAANATITASASAGATITVNGQAYNASATYGPGTYTIVATASNGNNNGTCTETTSVTITEPDAITLSETHINNTCNAATAGSINLSVNGGTPSYTYNWSNGSTTEDISSLAAGTYTVTVTDANGCAKSTSIVITQPNVLNATVNHTELTCSTAADGTISITSPSGGFGTYEFTINGGTNWQSSGSFTGLTAGSYNVQIRDAAQTGCVITLNSSLTVIVNDTLYPVINNSPNNITKYSESGNNTTCEQLVTWTAPTATDNCAVSSFTSNYSSGASFPVGNTTVTYTAVDNNGNVTTSSFVVTVVDNTTPQFTFCPSPVINTPVNASGCVATIAMTPPTYNDNCGVTKLTWTMTGATTASSALTGINTISSPYSFNPGTTTVTYTAVDAAGNSKNCIFTISVVNSLQGAISGTATVAQNTTAPNITFTGSGGTKPYTFAYTMNAGANQTIATSGTNNTTTTPQSTATVGQFVYTLVSVTDAYGCTGALTSTTTAIVDVLTTIPRPDLYSSVDEPANSTFSTGELKDGYVSISNASVDPTTGAVTFSVIKPVNFTLEVPASMSTSQGQAVNNSDWNILDIPGLFVFTSKPGALIDGNFASSKIGFKLTAIGGAGSRYIMTTSINNGTGGSSNVNGDSNNNNNQSVILFIIN